MHTVDTRMEHDDDDDVGQRSSEWAKQMMRGSGGGDSMGRNEEEPFVSPGAVVPRSLLRAAYKKETLEDTPLVEEHKLETQETYASGARRKCVVTVTGKPLVVVVVVAVAVVAAPE
jgi:hypothetical protein